MAKLPPLLYILACFYFERAGFLLVQIEKCSYFCLMPILYQQEIRWSVTFCRRLSLSHSPAHVLICVCVCVCVHCTLGWQYLLIIISLMFFMYMLGLPFSVNLFRYFNQTWPMPFWQHIEKKNNNSPSFLLKCYYFFSFFME